MRWIFLVFLLCLTGCVSPQHEVKHWQYADRYPDRLHPEPAPHEYVVPIYSSDGNGLLDWLLSVIEELK